MVVTCYRWEGGEEWWLPVIGGEGEEWWLSVIDGWGRERCGGGYERC